MTMWTTREDPKKLIRIAGVWVDPVAVVSVRDTQAGVRVFLSSGAEFDIKHENLTADKFVKLMSEAARNQ